MRARAPELDNGQFSAWRKIASVARPLDLRRAREQTAAAANNGDARRQEMGGEWTTGAFRLALSFGASLVRGANSAAS